MDGGPEPGAVRRGFTRAAPGYAESDFLHREIRARLLGRLAFMRIDPTVVVDLGAGPPEATRDLAERFPAAHTLAADSTCAMLGAQGQPWSRVTAAAEQLPVPGASVDLVVAGMLLHWCADLHAVLREVRRVLRHPGLFLFSTLGPDTLRELRTAWATTDSRSHTLAFADMHDIGDSLLHAGLAEPVLESEHITVTYADPENIFQDLRAVGCSDLSPTRRQTLTAPGRWRAMVAAYEAMRNAQGLLPVTIEVIYGQAWSRDADPVTRGSDVEVPLSRIPLRRRPV